MTSSWLKHYSTQLVGVTFVLLGAVAAPSQATTLTGFRTEGDMMSGMKVTVSFLDGTSQTSIWGDTDDRSGTAFGSNWSLTQSRDSYSSPWTLTNSGQGITSLVINAIPGNTVFDTYPFFSGPLQTDGSAEGWAFETKSGQSPSSFAYSDPIDISKGDLFGTLSLYWNTGFTGELSFRADTDSGSSDDPVKPQDPVAQNSPPTVDLSLPTIYEGQSASTSLYATDLDEDTITFLLNGVNQGTDLNRSRTHAINTNLGLFPDNGEFTYTAQARDEDGNSSNVVTKTLTVLNVEPILAELDIPTIYEGQSASANISATDPGADAISFFLNDRDVGTDVSTSGIRSVKAELGYFADNDYIPYTGHAVDKDGSSSKPVYSGLTILNVAPTLDSFNLSQRIIYEGQSVSAQMFSSDPGADWQRFFINGKLVDIDLHTSGTRSAAKDLGTFADEGKFVFRGRVQDKDNAFSELLRRKLLVLNVAPTITEMTQDLIATTDELFNFSAAATDPGVNDILTYQWDFNMDGLFDDFTGSSGEWSFAQEGVHKIGLQVSDGDGGYAYSYFTVSAVSDDVVPSSPISNSGQKVPEPGSVLSILAVGAVGGSAVLKRQLTKHKNIKHLR
jgi:hypothetical protein